VHLVSDVGKVLELVLEAATVASSTAVTAPRRLTTHPGYGRVVRRRTATMF
jgi:hypothetical protein